MQAERVHRADGSALQAHLLAAKVGVSGAGADFIGQTAGNIRTQFGGRRIGKGHNEEAISIRRVFGVRNQTHHTLHQNPCLAGACRRRDEQTPAARTDCRRLSRGKLNFFFRHGVFPFAKSRAAPGRSFERKCLSFMIPEQRFFQRGRRSL